MGPILNSSIIYVLLNYIILCLPTYFKYYYNTLEVLKLEDFKIEKKSIIIY